MPPECEEIEDHGVPEKISCIDGRIKEHLRIPAPATLCGANVYPCSFLCFRLLFPSYVYVAPFIR